MTLTSQEADERLRAMLQADEMPALTGDEVAVLLDDADRGDAGDGLRRYDLNAAAAEGWRWKAGKVAGLPNVTADGASFDRDSVRDTCLEMSARYAAKRRGRLRARPQHQIVQPGWSDWVGR